MLLRTEKYRPMACSATADVLQCGVFAMAIPRRRQASLSTVSVPEAVTTIMRSLGENDSSRTFDPIAILLIIRISASLIRSLSCSGCVELYSRSSYVWSGGNGNTGVGRKKFSRDTTIW